MKAIQTFIALSLIAAATVGAAKKDDPLALLERKQEGILDTTTLTGKRLDLIVDEFERNGLDGPDVDVLRAIRLVLGDLSDNQIREIVGLLGDAQFAEDDTEAREKALLAFSGQKTVIVQLRRILLEYRAQIALHEIARRVRELGDRQTTNLHEAISLSTRLEGVPARGSSEDVSMRLQGAEQTAIGGEVDTVQSDDARVA